MTAYFNRFSLSMGEKCVADCSHVGACDSDVEFWSCNLIRPDEITPDKLRDELNEYGAWTAEELADDAANWRRIIWLAAGNIKEESN